MARLSMSFFCAQATETAVKEMDLTSGRVLAFANHGLVAGDLKNAEPALVLTPPEKGNIARRRPADGW